MAIETAADRAALLADFGVSVTYTKAGGGAVSIVGIFYAPFIAVQFDQVDAADVKPVVRVRSADLPAGAAELDAVSVVDDFGQVHDLVVKDIRPDGTGFTILELAKA